MASFSSLFKEQLRDYYQKELEHLATGNVGQGEERIDYAMYRQAVGYLTGLKAAIALCEEIERNME